MDGLYSLLWVLRYEDDIYADMLHLFGVDIDSTDISSARFFSLCYRIRLYGESTALNNTLALEEEKDKPAPKEEVKQVSLDYFLQKRAEARMKEEG